MQVTGSEPVGGAGRDQLTPTRDRVDTRRYYGWLRPIGGISGGRPPC